MISTLNTQTSAYKGRFPRESIPKARCHHYHWCPAILSSLKPASITESALARFDSIQKLPQKGRISGTVRRLELSHRALETVVAKAVITND